MSDDVLKYTLVGARANLATAKVAVTGISVTVCQKIKGDDPGTYYSRKALEARYLRELLQQVKWDSDATKYINKALERAQYTGD